MRVKAIIIIAIAALVFGFSIAKAVIFKKEDKKFTRLIAGKVVDIRDLVR